MQTRPVPKERRRRRRRRGPTGRAGCATSSPRQQDSMAPASGQRRGLVRVRAGGPFASCSRWRLALISRTNLPGRNSHPIQGSNKHTRAAPSNAVFCFTQYLFWSGERRLRLVLPPQTALLQLLTGLTPARPPPPPPLLLLLSAPQEVTPLLILCSKLKVCQTRADFAHHEAARRKQTRSLTDRPTDGGSAGRAASWARRTRVAAKSCALLTRDWIC